ncbi:hypothetical protein BDN72DRAFT_959814 [Pluteus cervinus]|uniref:Uncharacterized protein n=1 Tax=Pluteus cervinus TaxID=181527 RepID=A0ACD3ASW6_9AGAR|nr:hypothetical protein BDN72DRAFT_959814 [Pluteus cervinus]
MPLDFHSLRSSLRHNSSMRSTSTSVSNTPTNNASASQDPSTPAHKSDLIFLNIDTVVFHGCPTQGHQPKFFFKVRQNGELEGVTKKKFRSEPALANADKDVEWKINREIAVSGTEIFLMFYRKRSLKSDVVIDKVDLLHTTISLTRENLIKHQAFTLDTELKQKVTIRLKPESINQLLEKIAAPASVVASLKKTQNTVDIIMKIADSLSELNPIAKVVVGLVSGAYDKLKDQKVCYGEVGDLLEKMSNMYPYIERAKDLWMFKNLQGVIKKLLDLYKETLAVINGHKLLSGHQQLFRFMFSSTQKDTYKSLADRFDALSNEFDLCLQTDWAARYQKDVVDTSLLPLQKVRFTEPDGCDPGTREEALQTISEWMSGSAKSRIFWLLGEEGMGKSTVAVTVFRDVRDNQKESRGALSYYTFSPASQNVAQNNPLNFLPTVCYQLCRHYMNYGMLVSRHLDTQPFFLTSTGHLETQFITLFCVPLEQLVKRYGAPDKPWILIIDGLDQCGPTMDRDVRAEIISYLLVLQEQWSWFKIVLTSRENPGTDWFNRVFNSSMVQSYKLTLENSQEDVRRYLEQRLPNILSSSGHPGANDEDQVRVIITRLTQNCKGNLKEAHRICEYLKKSLDIERGLFRMMNPGREPPEINLLGPHKPNVDWMKNFTH